MGVCIRLHWSPDPGSGGVGCVPPERNHQRVMMVAIGPRSLTLRLVARTRFRGVGGAFPPKSSVSDDECFQPTSSLRSVPGTQRCDFRSQELGSGDVWHWPPECLSEIISVKRWWAFATTFIIARTTGMLGGLRTATSETYDECGTSHNK